MPKAHLRSLHACYGDFFARTRVVLQRVVAAADLHKNRFLSRDAEDLGKEVLLRASIAPFNPLDLPLVDYAYDLEAC